MDETQRIVVRDTVRADVYVINLFYNKTDRRSTLYEKNEKKLTFLYCTVRWKVRVSVRLIRRLCHSAGKSDYINNSVVPAS